MTAFPKVPNSLGQQGPLAPIVGTAGDPPPSPTWRIPQYPPYKSQGNGSIFIYSQVSSSSQPPHSQPHPIEGGMAQAGR